MSWDWGMTMLLYGFSGSPYLWREFSLAPGLTLIGSSGGQSQASQVSKSL